MFAGPSGPHHPLVTAAHEKASERGRSTARLLHSKFGGADGLFGLFIRRVQSGGFAVQAAMLLPAQSVSKLAYLQRCLS